MKQLVAANSASHPETASADRRSTTPAGLESYCVARVAAGVRAAAHDAGVALTFSYAKRVAAEGIARCDQLGVTKLGDGVVIHTAPDIQGGLPVVLGFASSAGAWFRDGSRHFRTEMEL